jgi:hypothetical protein
MGRKRISKNDKEIIDLSNQDNINLLKNDRGIKSIFPPTKLVGNKKIGNLSTNMSEIVRMGQLDNDLLLKNDKIGLASLAKSDAIPYIPDKLSQSEQDLIKSYIENLPQNYEYQSTEFDPRTNQENTITKYKKYVNPSSDLIPDLMEVPEFMEEIINQFPDAEKHFSQETNKFINQRIDYKDKIEKHIRFKKQVLNRLNEGEYPSEHIKTILHKLEEREHALRDEEAGALHMLNHYTSDFKNIQDNYDYYKKEANIIKKENLRKADAYRDELNILNSGGFSTEKEPNETEAQYLERLVFNGQVETPENELENAQHLVRKLFKEKMRELIKNPYLIEELSNSLDNYNSVDNKQNILKKWNFFKREFLTIYGYNPELDMIEIKEFFQIADPLDPVEPNRENQPSKQHVSIKYNTVDKNAIIYRGGKGLVGFRIVELNEEEFQLIYSFPKKDQLHIWRQNASKNHISSLGHIEEVTGLTDNDFKELFDIKIKINSKIIIDKLFNNGVLPVQPPTKSSVLQYVPVEETQAESKLRAGYGIKTDEYPEYIEFGNVLLNLKKLHHFNLLVIKTPRKASVDGFPVQKVSETFVNIIFNIIHKKDPSFSDLNKLSEQEKDLYDVLISTSGLKKKLYNTHEKTIEKLKRRLKLLESEVEIGNNNPSILEEIIKILKQLNHLKVISITQVRSHIKHIKTF